MGVRHRRLNTRDCHIVCAAPPYRPPRSTTRACGTNGGRSATVKRGSPFGRCGIDHAKTAGADLADLERALGDAAVVEAEDAVDPAESVGGEQAARRKIAPRFPVDRKSTRLNSSH